MSKPHLAALHRFWKEFLQPSDIVIDATCGNGHDTLILSRLAKEVYALDIQQEAIEKAKSLVKADNIHWFVQSHEHFPSKIQPETVALITYNLGYLPGGNKEIITLADSTLRSVKNGLPLLKNGGAITVMCYPGHAGGEEEEQALVDFISSLDSKRYLVEYTQWPNRKKHPSLIKVVLL